MTKDTISFQEAKRIMVDIRDTYRMVDVLSNDLDRIRENLDSVKVQDELQFWLRIAVRSAIDSLDAHKYRLKLLTKTTIKVKELEPLPKPEKKKKKSLANFFNELAYALESTYRMKEDDGMLKEYQKARDIRNRITHPKESSNLNVTLDEYLKIIAAYQWFGATFSELLKQSSSKRPPR